MFKKLRLDLITSLIMWVFIFIFRFLGEKRGHQYGDCYVESLKQIKRRSDFKDCILSVKFYLTLLGIWKKYLTSSSFSVEYEEN